MRRGPTGMILVLLIVHAPRARAGDAVRCAPMDGGSASLAVIDAHARLAFVRGVMEDQAHRARTWSWAWALGGLGLSAGNFALVALGKTPDGRIDSWVGGVTSLFIPAAIVVKPLAVIANHATLEDYLSRVASQRGEADACATLARAEELFVASADDEALGVGVLAQAVAIVGNAAIALFLGIGYHHWGGALLNGGGGLAITEVQIWTQPVGASRARERYRQGAWTTPGEASVHWSVAPLFVAASPASGTPAARGIAIGASF